MQGAVCVEVGRVRQRHSSGMAVWWHLVCSAVAHRGPPRPARAADPLLGAEVLPCVRAVRLAPSTRCSETLHWGHFAFLSAGVEPGALRLLDKGSAAQPRPQPSACVLKVFLSSLVYELAFHIQESV